MKAFDWLSVQVEKLLSYALYGADFVFGDTSSLAYNFRIELLKLLPFIIIKSLNSFAFGVLPTIIFFSMLVSILYYIGFMTYFIGKLSWLFEISCGTSGPETVAVVGNIFIGQTESPLLIKPYLKDLTVSEVFC